MDEVASGGGEIVITKNGKPISRLVPYRERPKESVRNRSGEAENSRRHRLPSGCQLGRGIEP